MNYDYKELAMIILAAVGLSAVWAYVERKELSWTQLTLALLFVLGGIGAFFAAHISVLFAIVFSGAWAVVFILVLLWLL